MTTLVVVLFIVLMLTLVAGGLRRLVWQRLLFLFMLCVAWIFQQITGRIPGWVTRITNAVGVGAGAVGGAAVGAAVATGGFIVSAAAALAWVLAVLTFLLIVGTGLHYEPLVSAVAAFAGTLVMTIYQVTGLINHIAKGKTPHINRDVEGAWEGITKFFWIWSLALFYIAFVVLFLGGITAEVTFREISMTVLGITVLLVASAIGLRIVYYLIVSTTAVGTLLVIAVMVFGSVDLFWTQVRFSNINQKSLAATEHRIEKLEQMKVHYGGLKPTHQHELDSLLQLKVRQQKAAAEAAARRSTTSFTWPEFLDFSDDAAMIRLLMFIALAVGVATYWLNRGKQTSTSTH